MVRDEVFAADTEVERVKVLELSPHALERSLGNARLLDNVVCELGTAEDVVPDFVNHVLGGDVGLATVMLSATIQLCKVSHLRLATEEVLVQPVGNRVVRHVDGRITETVRLEQR